MFLQTQQRGFDWSELDLFLAFSEPLDDWRRISCFLCSKDKIALFHIIITLVHDMEF